jgi:hypothetical protein
MNPRVPFGANFSFQALSDIRLRLHQEIKMGEFALDNEDIIDCDDKDVLDPLFFELVVVFEVSPDLGGARRSERARDTDLLGLAM